VDLEKAFDRVPREVINWAMHKLGVQEWLVSTVMSMYTGAKTLVRTFYGNSKGFEVKVGMHQGSALSPLLFMIVMEAISKTSGLYVLTFIYFRPALCFIFVYNCGLTVRNKRICYVMPWHWNCCMLMTWQ